MFKISVIFSVRSTSESCMLFVCVVFVLILLTYCSLEFFVSSSFIVISACSNLSTFFGNLYQVLELKMNAMLSFLSLLFVIVFLESSSRFLSFLCFYYHAY